MFVYAVVEGESGQVNDVLLTHKKKLSNKKFKKLYNEAVSHIKSKDKTVTIERIAKYLVKNHKFEYIHIELGAWGRTFGMRKIKRSDELVKRGNTAYFVLD